MCVREGDGVSEHVHEWAEGIIWWCAECGSCESEQCGLGDCFGAALEGDEG